MRVKHFPIIGSKTEGIGFRGLKRTGKYIGVLHFTTTTAKNLMELLCENTLSIRATDCSENSGGQKLQETRLSVQVTLFLAFTPNKSYQLKLNIFQLHVLVLFESVLGGHRGSPTIIIFFGGEGGKSLEHALVEWKGFPAPLLCSNCSKMEQVWHRNIWGQHRGQGAGEDSSLLRPCPWTEPWLDPLLGAQFVMSIQEYFLHNVPLA